MRTETIVGGRLELYPADRPEKQETVLICPGGGYHFLAPREALPPAGAWNRAGYHAAVLNYRLDLRPLGKRPLIELAWAVRKLRTDPDWKERAERVWVAGFSAGGHLAASLGVFWNRDEMIPEEFQKLSRPDGLILGYPVISMGAFAHVRSVECLTGGDTELLDLFSLEKQDLSQMPPVFLWNTRTDEKVSAMNSLLLAEKIVRDGGDCEFHMFHRGCTG